MSQRKANEAFAGVDRPGQHKEPAMHSSRSNALSVFGAACLLTDDPDGDAETDLLDCFKGDSAATVDRFDARLLLSTLPPPLPSSLPDTATTDARLPGSGKHQHADTEAELDADRFNDLWQRLETSPGATPDSADAGEPVTTEEAICASEYPSEEPTGAALPFLVQLLLRTAPM